MSYVQRGFYVGTAPVPIDPSLPTAEHATLQWVVFSNASGVVPELPASAVVGDLGEVTIVSMYNLDGNLYTEPGVTLQTEGVMRVLTSFDIPLGSAQFVANTEDNNTGGDAGVLETLIIEASPRWYWKLDETTGQVASNRMSTGGVGDLTYESPADTAGYTAGPSGAVPTGQSKSIAGSTARQIYDNNVSASTFNGNVIRTGPEWFWPLSEVSGTVATDVMLNGDLKYEVDASTAGYASSSSLIRGDGTAKDIDGDATRQIYDPSLDAPLANIYYSMDTNNGTTLIQPDRNTTGATDITLTNAVLDAGGFGGSTGISTTNSGVTDGQGAGSFGFTPSAITGYSVSIRLKTSGVTAPSESNPTIGLMTHGFNGVDEGLAMFIAKEGEATAGRLTLLYGYLGGGFRGFSSSTPVNDGQWHTWTFTVANEICTLYLDGVQYDQRDYSADTLVPAGGDFLLLRRVGKDAALGVILDDFQFWTRELTATEVLAVALAT